MSNDKLLSALKASKNENKTRIDKIRQEIKELDHKLSKQELKEIENKKGLSASKKAKKYLNKLEEKIYELNTYYDYDDLEHRGIKDISDLFDWSISKDY